MTRLLKHAARVLLTASIVGTQGPAWAQVVATPIPAPVQAVATPVPPAVLPAALTVTGDPLPPIVPPVPVSRLSPERRGTTAGMGAAKSPVGVFAADKTAESVNLMAVPTVPSSWAADTVKTPPPAPLRAETVAVTPAAPKKIPVEITGKIATGNPWAMTPNTSALDASGMAKPAPKTSTGPWAVEHAPVRGQSRDWPAAFVEYDPHPLPGPRPVSHVEPEKKDAPRAAPVAVMPAALREKAAHECGGLAQEVKVVVRPDQSMVVHVRPVNHRVERPLLDRLLKLPEMSAPNVHLEIDQVP